MRKKFMYILWHIIYHNKRKSSRSLNKNHLIFTKFVGLVKIYYNAIEFLLKLTIALFQKSFLLSVIYYCENEFRKSFRGFGCVEITLCHLLTENAVLFP